MVTFMSVLACKFQCECVYVLCDAGTMMLACAKPAAFLIARTLKMLYTTTMQAQIKPNLPVQSNILLQDQAAFQALSNE